jgi:hypothetical protein
MGTIFNCFLSFCYFKLYIYVLEDLLGSFSRHKHVMKHPHLTAGALVVKWNLMWQQPKHNSNSRSGLAGVQADLKVEERRLVIEIVAGIRKRTEVVPKVKRAMAAGLPLIPSRLLIQSLH